MKILFLLPPSEGKNIENKYEKESLSFSFIKPNDIAISASEKDLKCIGKRFQKGIDLNKNIEKSLTNEAICRYSGVMYDSINYLGMTESGKYYFDNNFLILSGMYGILKPQDKIGNYKLPIETKGLYDYWSNSIAEKLSSLDYDMIVNLLPISYSKLVGIGPVSSKFKKNLDLLLANGKQVININFLKEDGKKISHGVKKVKGEWINYICENNIDNINEFGGEKKYITDGVYDIDIVIK